MMGAEKQAEGTAIFVIALSFVVGVSIALFLAIWGEHQRARSDLSPTLSQEARVDEPVQGLTVAEQRQAWSEAMEGLIQERNRDMDLSNAGYKFDACFMVAGRCEVMGSAIRDEFQKTTFYFPMTHSTEYVNHVSFYLSLKDGEMPQVMMRFVYVGGEPIYINKALILVENEFVLEEYLPENAAERKAVNENKLYEKSELRVTEKLDVIERIANAEMLAVRIEGQSGYVHLNKGMLDAMQAQASEILEMYELTTQALEGAMVAKP